jgi:hypothetical protein
MEPHIEFTNSCPWVLLLLIIPAIIGILEGWRQAGKTDDKGTFGHHYMRSKVGEIFNEHHPWN